MQEVPIYIANLKVSNLKFTYSGKLENTFSKYMDKIFKYMYLIFT